MKKIIAVLLCALMLFPLYACKETSNSEDHNKQTIKLGSYNIEFNKFLLGDAFSNAGNEIKNCNYSITFKEDRSFVLDMNFSNSLSGVWVELDDKITCYAESHQSEFSPPQKIDIEIIFNIIDSQTLEILEASEGYTVKVADLTGSGETFTDEEKEMSLWPLIPGIIYTIE